MRMECALANLDKCLRWPSAHGNIRLRFSVCERWMKILSNDKWGWAALFRCEKPQLYWRGDRNHLYPHQIYSQICMDSPDVCQENALILDLKVSNDTTSPDGLFSKVLYLFVLSKIPVCLKDLPNLANRMNSVCAARDKLPLVIAAGRIRLHNPKMSQQSYIIFSE